MKEAEFSVDPHTGHLVVRGADSALLTALADHLGTGVDLDCGECPTPESGRRTSAAPEKEGLVRVAGFVHQSMVDGPGLRSVVFFQGCGRACPGCRNLHTHDPGRGVSMTVEAVLAELLRPDFMRDGITISGGEPFGQANACAELVTGLKTAGMHIVIYTGYKLEKLARSTDPAIRQVLELADVIIDGPYAAALYDRKLAYRGSSNQRVIDLAATRSTGELRVLRVD